MTLEDIAERVRQIREHAVKDDERAHAREDELFYDFVRFVASSGAGELSDKASAVLKSLDIEFCRWCA